MLGLALMLCVCSLNNVYTLALATFKYVETSQDHSPQTPLALLRIHITQVAVPPQRHHIHHQHSMLQRHEAKVHQLHCRPEHPIRLQYRPVRILETLLHAAALHVGHVAEETGKVRGGEDELVEADAGEDCCGLAGGVDARGEEFEPRRRGGAEDGCMAS